jgi:hypothetical protein
MATYSNIGIKLITTGDESGTWGTSTNTNFSDVLDEAIAGAVTYNISSDADFTLTVSDGTSSDARHAVIKFTSTTLTATRVCTFAPNDLQKTWVVINSTTGGQSLTFKQGSAGGTVTVPNGESAIIYSDGGGSSAGAVTRVLDSFTNTKITTGTLNATTLDLTNLEVTNIKAKDGTAALTIADSTGKVTVSTELAVDNLNLSGNAITSTDTNGNIDLTPNGTGEVNITKVDIDSGAIDGTPIGASSASTGAFTTLSASSTVSGTGFSTYLASPPAIGSTAANTGAFTTLTTSSTVTLNGGTANGVLYLNGSKVATSGSALTFDGTTFQLSRSSGDIILNDTSGSTSIRFLTTGGINYLQTGGSTSGTYAPLAFTNRGGTAEYMRLTDTGLGIGTTSPATKLQVEAAAARCDTRISRNQSSGEIGTLQFAALDSGSAAQVYTQIISGITSATAGAEQGYLAFETVNAGAVAERMRLDTSGNFSVNTTSAIAGAANRGNITIGGSAGSILSLGTSASAYGYLFYDTSNSSMELWNYSNSFMRFGTNNTERARITTSGILGVGVTNPTGSSADAVGAQVGPGYVVINRSSAGLIFANRRTTDGELVRFLQDDVAEGDISVSGTTVSYNGGHLSRWSQTADNTRIPLLKGTIMSNLDQMAVWEKDDQPLPNEQLNCMKVSDVEGDVNVAGVFVNWDNDDDEYTNDMNVAMTGDMIIRIAQGVVVQRGDLLMSAGDGTAKPQGDDIRRSKTIAKVTSTHVTCTYDDGSYCVPCVLMAC